MPLPIPDPGSLGGWASCISLWHEACLPSWNVGACFSALPPTVPGHKRLSPIWVTLETPQRPDSTGRRPASFRALS